MRILNFELNELCFDRIKNYVDQGKLPLFSGLLKENRVSQTVSGESYPYLEPWIQWPTLYTGLTYKQHEIYRLGDVVEKNLNNIWQVLESQGISVGAVSPMNAENRCKAPDFFLPDPWTSTKLVADQRVAALYRTLADLVNDNATRPPGVRVLTSVFLQSLPFLNIQVVLWGVKNLRYILRYKWAKAVALDVLLYAITANLAAKKGTEYVSLFLNAGAHIQHHHMYDSFVYQGPNRNPSWYSDARVNGDDPLLFVYEAYEFILRDSLRDESSKKIITTGLSQKPNEHAFFQYRLKDASMFIESICQGLNVSMRMSRDFLVNGDQNLLARVRDGLLDFTLQGSSIFEIEERESSLFVQIGYTGPIEGFKEVAHRGQPFDLRDMVSLVSIENALHQDIGYVVDVSDCLRMPEGRSGKLKLEKFQGILLESMTGESMSY